MRFRERQRQAREQEIVQVARQLLMTKGYHGTSMDEVAETVGISKATLYHHFPSKDDLISRLIVDYLDRLLALLERPDDDAGPAERLTAALRFLIAGHAQGLGPDVEAQVGELRALVLGRPECRERYERVVQRLAALVQAGQARGVLRADLAPLVVVHALFGLSCAAGVLCGPRGGALDAGRAADSLVSLFLDGVRLASSPGLLPVGGEEEDEAAAEPVSSGDQHRARHLTAGGGDLRLGERGT